MPKHQHPSISQEARILLSVEEAAAALGINRSTMYDLLASGRVAAVRIGRRRLVSRRALEEFVQRNEERPL